MNNGRISVLGIVFDKVTENILSDLEKTQKEFWNVPRKTAFLLNTFVKMIKAKNVLEIGTSNGYSGIWIAKALKETGGRLTTIEYYDKRQSIAVNNFKECGVFDVARFLQGSACEILEALSEDEIFDFVFIDANKSEYIKYFELVKSHLAKNAMVVADNILSHYEKVESFINAVENDEEFQSEILDIEGGFLIAYKNKDKEL